MGGSNPRSEFEDPTLLSRQPTADTDSGQAIDRNGRDWQLFDLDQRCTNRH